jgi:hypothetical protein
LKNNNVDVDSNPTSFKMEKKTQTKEFWWWDTHIVIDC